MTSAWGLGECEGSTVGLGVNSSKLRLNFKGRSKVKEKDTITISMPVAVRRKFRANCDQFDVSMSAVLKEAIRRFNLLAESGSVDPWIELFGGSAGRTGGKYVNARLEGANGGVNDRETVSQRIQKPMEKEPRLTAFQKVQQQMIEKKAYQCAKPWEFNPIPIGKLTPMDDSNRLIVEQWWRANRPGDIGELTIFDDAQYYDEAWHLYNDQLDGYLKGCWSAMSRGDAVWVFEALREKNPIVYESTFWDRRFMRMGNEANWREFKQFFPPCKEAFIENTTTESQMLQDIKKAGRI